MLLGGRGPRERRRPRTTRTLFTDPVSLSFGDLNVTRGGARRSMLARRLRRRRTAPARGRSRCGRSRHPTGVAVDVAGAVTVAPGGDALVPVTARAAADAGDGRGLRLPPPPPRRRRAEGPVRVPRHAAGARGCRRSRRCSCFQTGDTRDGVSRASAYRYPAAAFGPAPSYTGAPVERGRRRAAVPDPHRRAGRQLRRGRGRLVGRLAHPPVAARLAGRERRPGLRRARRST